jgi:DNA-binding beta-propeller fold protein YncE
LFLALFPVATSSAPLEPPPVFIAEWGTSGIAEGQFSTAVGVALDGVGDVYALDDSNSRIQVFDSEGAFLRMWGWGVLNGSSTLQTCTSGCQAGIPGSGDGQFDTPTSIAVSSPGRVYVADTSNHRIQMFDSSGTFLGMWGWGVSDGSTTFQTCTSGCQAGISGNGDGQLSWPKGVAVANSGSVYVADQGNNRIQVFDGSGNYLFQWGSGGTGDGQFSNPRDIAVSESGHVYVTEVSSDRIQKFDSSGTFLAKWGSTGTGDGQFDSPEGIGIDSSGNVYVVDTGNHRLQKFDGRGNFLSKWGTLGGGDGEFWWPKDVAASSSGYKYVIEHGNHRIQKFGGPWLDVFVGKPAPRPD